MRMMLGLPLSSITTVSVRCFSRSSRLTGLSLVSTAQATPPPLVGLSRRNQVWLGRPRCMTARDRLRAWDVIFVGSSNLTHKSCGIFVASWGFAHCIGTRLVFHIFFYLTVRRTNGTMQKTHKVLKMRLLIFTLAAFIRGTLGPQRLLIQIWRSSVTDACKQFDKS